MKRAENRLDDVEELFDQADEDRDDEINLTACVVTNTHATRRDCSFLCTLWYGA